MSQNLQNFVKFRKFQLENLVDFEKSCKTHIYLQKSVLIQPKTSNILPNFCQKLTRRNSWTPGFQAPSPAPSSPARKAAWAPLCATWAVELTWPVDITGGRADITEFWRARSRSYRWRFLQAHIRFEKKSRSAKIANFCWVMNFSTWDYKICTTVWFLRFSAAPLRRAGLLMLLLPQRVCGQEWCFARVAPHVFLSAIPAFA